MERGVLVRAPLFFCALPAYAPCISRPYIKKRGLNLRSSLLCFVVCAYLLFSYSNSFSYDSVGSSAVSNNQSVNFSSYFYSVSSYRVSSSSFFLRIVAREKRCAEYNSKH